MTDQETSVANFFETELTAEMGPTDLTATVTSTSGLTSPTFLVIEPDTPAQREVILFDGTFTGTTFVTSTINNRYLSGSGAGSGITHPVGAKVRSAPLAQHLDDLNDRVDADAAVVTSHAADADAHHAESHTHDGVDGSGTLAAGSVDTTQLAAAAVTNPKIGPSAVDTSEIADDAVSTAKIADDAVTVAKLANAIMTNLEVDNSTEVASAALTGTLANVASVSLSIPATWNSWKCEAWASYVASGGAGNEYEAAIRIDGTDQQTKGPIRLDTQVDAGGNSGDGDGSVGGRRTGMATTGSRSVSLRAREVSGSVTFTDVYLYARAVRTS